MAIAVQYLIDEWEHIRDMMAPSQKLFPQLSAVDRDIAELSLLSSRREYWEVLICLMGYSQSVGDDPNKVLLSIPFEQIWVGNIKEPWETEPFLRYCSTETGFKTVPREAFLPAVYTIKRVLAQGTVSITPRSIERFQECVRQYNHNWPKVWNCYKEEDATDR